MGHVELFQPLTLGSAYRHPMATATNIDRNANRGDNPDCDASKRLEVAKPPSSVSSTTEPHPEDWNIPTDAPDDANWRAQQFTVEQLENSTADPICYLHVSH